MWQTFRFACIKLREIFIISVCLFPQSVIYNNFSSNLIYSKPTEYNIVTLVRGTYQSEITVMALKADMVVMLTYASTY